MRLPLTAEWEATSACNYRCPHCGEDAGKPLDDELDTAEALKMFDALRDFGVKRLIITGGEFTLRKDWRILLEHAVAFFEEPQVVTNGSLGSEFVRSVSEICRKDRLLISLSLDGTEDVHDGRRGRGAFRRIKEILDDGLSGRIDVITVLARDNIDDLENLKSFLSGYELSGWRIQLALPLGRMRNAAPLSREQIESAAAVIGGWIGAKKGKLKNITCDQWLSKFIAGLAGDFSCPAGRESMVILPDGSIVSCSLNRELVCGNIRVESISNIWYGKVMSALRAITAKKGLTCRTCSPALRDSSFF